jgi:hypothetical protein
MKLLFLVFVFVIITISAKADVIRGSVKYFEAPDVEMNRNYSYYALETEEGERLILPSWIDAEKVASIRNHEILLDGSVKFISCFDVRQNCPTAEIKKINWFQFYNLETDSKNHIYTGSVRRYFGTAVESSESYDYVTIETGKSKIEVPDILDEKLLLGLDAQVTLIGEVLSLFCTDMSEACSPSKVKNISMLQVQL